MSMLKSFFAIIFCESIFNEWIYVLCLQLSFLFIFCSLNKEIIVVYAIMVSNLRICWGDNEHEKPSSSFELPNFVIVFFILFCLAQISCRILHNWDPSEFVLLVYCDLRRYTFQI